MPRRRRRSPRFASLGHSLAPKRRKRMRGRLSQKLRKIVSGSPTGQPPAPKLRSARERRRGFAMAVAEASAVAQKIASGSPTGQLPRQNYGSERERRAPPRLLRKLRPSPRKFSREARRARPRRQNDGNELSGSPTGQTQAQTFDDSSRCEKWHATRPGRVSANPKP